MNKTLIIITILAVVSILGNFIAAYMIRIPDYYIYHFSSPEAGVAYKKFCLEGMTIDDTNKCSYLMNDVSIESKYYTREEVIREANLT